MHLANNEPHPRGARSYKWLLVCTILWSTLSIADTQLPVFDGTWQLNLSASALGKEHPFPNYSLTRKLALDGLVLHETDISVNANIVNIPLADATISTDYILDGVEHQVTGRSVVPWISPPQMRQVCEWQGSTLVITLHNVVENEAAYIERRLFLSADGTQLIESNRTLIPFGDNEQRLVFDRVQHAAIVR